MQNRGEEVGGGRLEGPWVPLASGVGEGAARSGGHSQRMGALLCSGGPSIRPGGGGGPVNGNGFPGLEGR